MDVDETVAAEQAAHDAAAEAERDAFDRMTAPAVDAEPDEETEPDTGTDHTTAAEDETEAVPAELEQAPPTPEQIAQAEQIVALETAQENYEKRVRKIMGPNVPLVACEACDGMGLVPPTGLVQPELRTHPDFQTCADCGGEGWVATGSKVSGFTEHKCPGCQGFGFRQRIDPEAPATQADNGHSEPTFGTPSWMGDPTLGAATR